LCPNTNAFINLISTLLTDEQLIGYTTTDVLVDRYDKCYNKY